VVGEHRRLSCPQTKRFSRRCGDVVVSAQQQTNTRSAVARSRHSWNGAATDTDAVVGASPLPVPVPRGEGATGSGAQVATPSTTLTKRKCVRERVGNHGVTKRRKSSASVHRVLRFEEPAQGDGEMVRIGIYTLDQRAHKIETWLNKKRARNEVIVRRVPKRAKPTRVKEMELRVPTSSKRKRNENEKQKD